MKKTIYLLLIVFAILVFLFMRKESRIDGPLGQNQIIKNQVGYQVERLSQQVASEQQPQKKTESTLISGLEEKSINRTINSEKTNHQVVRKKMLSYTIDHGVAVLQRDMVLGEVSALDSGDTSPGFATEPQIRIWPTNEIPFFIQADLPNQERVIEALRMFSGTRIRFVPYASQADAIVFERKEGVCKSYVGYIGGLQKIYLSDKCGATEVAHEIMHSLGFVHEQNRSDRDQFIQIFWDNIDPQEKINFEKFSEFAMKASGAASFDFESIMMYPDNMFSQNHNLTMKPIVEGQKIEPSETLSAKDIERLNKIY